MSLSRIAAVWEVVEIEGEEFKIRSLTRAEAARFQNMAAHNKTLADLEVAVVAAGTETPVDEVQAWYKDTATHVVDTLIVAIKDLSRLDEGAQKSGGTGDSPG
jgi:hypothetical protein